LKKRLKIKKSNKKDKLKEKVVFTEKTKRKDLKKVNKNVEETNANCKSIRVKGLIRASRKHLI
jgi:hypothetical protein